MSGLQSSRKRMQAADRNVPLLGDKSFILLWYTGTNTHSNPIYVNSATLSHITKDEKAGLKRGDVITVKEKTLHVKAIVIKVGSFNVCCEAEKTAAGLAEQNADTDEVLTVLLTDIEDSDEEGDPPVQPVVSSDSESDEDVPPPKKVHLNELLELEKQKLAALNCSTGVPRKTGAVVPPTTKLKNTKTPPSTKTPPHYKNTANTKIPPRSTVASSAAASAGAFASTSVEVGSASVTTNSSGSAVTPLLVLESRVQTALLRNIASLLEENNRLLRGLACEVDVTDRPCVSKVYQGHDGDFETKELSNALPNVFAREFVRKKYSKEYFTQRSWEPKGKTKGNYKGLTCCFFKLAMQTNNNVIKLTLKGPSCFFAFKACIIVSQQSKSRSSQPRMDSYF